MPKHGKELGCEFLDEGRRDVFGKVGCARVPLEHFESTHTILYGIRRRLPRHSDESLRAMAGEIESCRCQDVRHGEVCGNRVTGHGSTVRQCVPFERLNRHLACQVPLSTGNFKFTCVAHTSLQSEFLTQHSTLETKIPYTLGSNRIHDMADMSDRDRLAIDRQLSFEQ